jgi:hypothetical protein
LITFGFHRIVAVEEGYFQGDIKAKNCGQKHGKIKVRCFWG